MNLTGFYRSFEEHFYAPRSTIKHLRKQYLPCVAPLAALYPGASTFDIGCGRGEWLELMQGSGFKPLGVDLDEGMLQACHELGLPALQGDAIAHLNTLADESQAVISAFHVVEHITFEQLQTLVFEALRALKPGGLLIMETPNPENMVVATRNFYLDPTHLRPIPPMLLGFLPEFHGFARVTTIRLQESPDIHTRTDIKLTDVLHSVSPDYAVIAQKKAPSEIMLSFDAPFAKKRGIDLHNLANRFDKRQDDLFAAHHITRTHLDAMQIQMQALHKENQTLRNSLSWKITAPLRGMSIFFASMVKLTTAKILQNPRVATRVNSVLTKFPSLHARLRSAAISQGLVEDSIQPNAEIAPLTEADLSPKAKQIHTSLQQEIARRQD